MHEPMIDFTHSGAITSRFVARRSVPPAVAGPKQADLRPGYDLKTRLLVDNPIDRYSIGDRTEGLKYNPDGSLTIYVQKDSPDKERESNWLPAPAGPMSIISRMYGPEASILDRSYKFPDLVRQDT